MARNAKLKKLIKFDDDQELMNRDEDIVIVDIKTLDKTLNLNDFELTSKVEAEKSNTEINQKTNPVLELKKIFSDDNKESEPGVDKETVITIDTSDLNLYEQKKNLPTLAELENLEGIKQVVVEKLTTEERHRIRLKFEIDGRIEEKIVYDNINNLEFLKRNNSKINIIRADQKDSFTKNAEVIKLDTGFKKPKIHFDEKQIVSKEKKIAKKLEKNLRLISKDNELESNSIIQKKSKYSNYVYDKIRERKSSEYFYRAENHQELFKVGTSFYSDFKKGSKNFAFSTPENYEAQKKTILGLASYFSHQEDLEILIISYNLFNSSFEDVIRKSDIERYNTFESIAHLGLSKNELSYYSNEAFDILDFREIEPFRRLMTENEYKEFINELTNRYDIILWDVPGLKVLEENRELFFPLTMKFEKVSLILGVNSSKISEIKKLLDFYKKYGINIKGVLVEQKDHVFRKWWQKIKL